jgi:peptidyl-dipeptidase Dcp
MVLDAAVDGRTAEFGPENPFYEASSLPFGAPPFDRIRDEDYEPALIAGMAGQMLEIRAIADNPDAPTFENTVVALEKTGALLDRVDAALGAVSGTNTNPAIEALEEAMAPRLAAHADAINLDDKLWRRVEAVWDARDGLGLDTESERLLEVTYKGFVRAGAKLDEAGKTRLKELNRELSTLQNAFSRKLLAATKAGAYVTEAASALAGLSEAQIAGAAAAAEARGIVGYALALHNTTQQPLLAQLSVRATRQALFERSWTRAGQGDENDTRATIARLAAVRAEKAKLLGFATYAAWKLEDQMAKTPGAAVEFLDAKVTETKALAAEELAEIQAVVDAQGGGFQAAAWDWDFYAEQVRKAKYDLDEAELRPYFEFDRVLRDGVFYAAERLFGIAFKERYDIPVWAAEVRVFEIANADGSHLALFYTDYFKRDNKRGGAWMSSFVRQSKLLRTTPVVYNVGNFARPAAGEPALISFDDVVTMFHEFGHTLHGIFSEAVYPALSGTSVPRDFVEFPSQFNEHWALDPEVFAHYAKHCQTGEAMPEELAAKLKRAKDFNRGYGVAEVLAAAQLDMEWHTLATGTVVEDTDAFEKAALAKKGLLLEAIPPRYRSSYFSHIFGGGYAAGYYAYLWSEMLEDAAIEWFDEHGGLTRENGERLRTMVLSRGNTEDLAAMYDRWYGGEGVVAPMTRTRALAE